MYDKNRTRGTNLHVISSLMAAAQRRSQWVPHFVFFGAPLWEYERVMQENK